MPDKNETDYNNNTSYIATNYDADQIYDFAMVYNGVGRGLSTAVPKSDTAYSNNSKIETGYTIP